jgi:ribose transport system substrate-binding protein
MLSKKPNAFIEFQADAKANYVIGAKFGAAKIPIVAIDVAVPGAPFMGTNNYKAAVMAGPEMAKLIRKKWGGWDGVDMVALAQMPAGGTEVMLRSTGIVDALAEEFGIEKNDPKIVLFDGGMGQAEQAKAGMDDVLAAHPDAVKIAMSSVNEQTMGGLVAAVQGAGRWDLDNKIVVTFGVDDLGKSQIRDGLSDGGIAYFPEHYGEYVIPAVAALLTGNAVPAYIFTENEVINLSNVDKWYPKKK